MANLGTYSDYVRSVYPTGGAAASYITALNIIDNLFKKHDVFNLKGESVTDIKDPLLIEQISEYIANEENKFKQHSPSLFDSGKSNQTSYPRGGFCKAAMRRLSDYVNLLCAQDYASLVTNSINRKAKISDDLLKRFNITDEGRDIEVQTKHRVGQNIFRSMLLQIYGSRCALTGIDIPEVLRASHILPWAENKTHRLNPENGICLSATYDAAFDKHLISFDEDYRLILSPMLKENYTSEAFKQQFRKLEGQPLIKPEIYVPSQEFLAEHRSKLVV